MARTAFLFLTLSAALFLLSAPLANAQLDEIDGVVVHLIADDIEPTEHGTVAVWRDSTEGSIQAEQAKSSSQPQLSAGVVNGHAVVRFDGVDDQLLLTGDITFSKPDEKSILAVVQSGDLNGHIIGAGSSSPGYLASYGYALALVGGKAFLKANGASSGPEFVSPETFNEGTARIIVATCSDSGCRLETNCSVAETDEAPYPYGYSIVTLGATGAAVDPFKGDVAEIIVYDRVLSDPEIDDVRNYLAVRYAIPVAERVDSDSDGVFDACDDGAVYLNAENSSVTVIAPPEAPESMAININNATASTSPDAHNQLTHFWRSGTDVELHFDFLAEYDLQKLHFWNYTDEGYDVDTATFTFFDDKNLEVDRVTFSPQLGAAPIFAEDLVLSSVRRARYVIVELSGTNGEVDFQNIGFTGVRSVPSPRKRGL